VMLPLLQINHLISLSVAGIVFPVNLMSTPTFTAQICVGQVLAALICEGI
jgi:hypothetical protein